MFARLSRVFRPGVRSVALSLAAAALLGGPAVSEAQADSRSSFSFSFGYSEGWGRGGYCGPGYGYGPRYYSGFSYHSYPRWGRAYCPPPIVYSRPVYYVEPAPVIVQQQPTVIYQQPAPPPAPVVIQQPAPQPVVVQQPAPQAVTYQTVYQPVAVDGWSLLGGDVPNLRGAVDAFAVEAERSPQRGTPRVGYAIAQALAGNDDKAAWSLRQALERDPDALRSVPVDGYVANHLTDLANRYEARLRDGFSRSDDAFMLASIRFMQRQYNAAHEAITTAIKTGDAAPSTARLASMIEPLRDKKI